MARNPHPQTIAELEHDDQVYGPAPPDERRRMIVELSRGALAKASDSIKSSRALLERTGGKLPVGVSLTTARLK